VKISYDTFPYIEAFLSFWKSGRSV